MKYEVIIDENQKEPKIVIYTDRMTDEISGMMNLLARGAEQTFMASSHRGTRIIKAGEIIRIYAERKKVYIQTSEGIFTTNFTAITSVMPMPMMVISAERFRISIGVPWLFRNAQPTPGSFCSARPHW